MSIVKPSLARDGFAHYYPEIEYEVVDELELKHEFDALEVDQFAPQGVNRFRRYANGFIMPWKPSSDVHWMPPVEDGLGQVLVRSFTLNAFLESFAVFDPAVSHYVSPISEMESTDSTAERCMILIDFSKTRQNI